MATALRDGIRDDVTQEDNETGSTGSHTNRQECELAVAAVGSRETSRCDDVTQQQPADNPRTIQWLGRLIARRHSKVHVAAVIEQLAGGEPDVYEQVMAVAKEEEAKSKPLRDRREQLRKERNAAILQRFTELVVPPQLDHVFLYNLCNDVDGCTENYCYTCNVVGPPTTEALKTMRDRPNGYEQVEELMRHYGATSDYTPPCKHCKHLVCFLCCRRKRNRAHCRQWMAATMWTMRLVGWLAKAMCCPPVPCLIVKRLVFQPPKCTYRFVVEPTAGKSGSEHRRYIRSARHVQSPFAEYHTIQVNQLPQPLWLIQARTKPKDKRKWFDVKVWRASFVITKTGHKLPYVILVPDENVYRTEQSKSRTSYSSAMYHTLPKGLYNPNDPKYVLIFSHTNAMDLGHCAEDPTLHHYVQKLMCPIVIYDYSGYGMATGGASESNAYDDIAAVFAETQRVLKVPAGRIVLLGYSLGTAVSVDLASRHPDIAGLILVGAFSSAMRTRMAIAESRDVCFDMFDSINKIDSVAVPTLFIHGMQDRITTVEQVEPMVSRAANLVEFYKIDTRAHMDVLHSSRCRIRIMKFLFDDLIMRRGRHRERRTPLSNSSTSTRHSVTKQSITNTV